MAGGYKVPREGEMGVRAIWRDLQQQIDALRGAAKLTSATISKGGLTVKNGGNITVDGGTLRSTFIFISGFLRPGDVRFVNDENGSEVRYGAEQNGDAFITSSTSTVRLPYTTTGLAANVRMLIDGTIQMVTSSLRYKQDVEDAVINTADVLALRGRTWRQRADVENDPNTTQRNIGFIAEELDALPSMRQFVIYDEQARPDSIQYDRITVALHAVMKDQAAQIAALTARVTALEATAPKP